MSASDLQGAMTQLSQELQVVDRQIEQLEAEVTQIRTQQSSMREAVRAIGELDTGATVQVPLGGGAFVRASIEDIDEVIVELGGDYAAEQDATTASETLQRKRAALDERAEELLEELETVVARRSELEQQVQAIQQQAQRPQQGE
jgi:prefoldin, archaeal alpha subunit/eukaryotic subunit 5